MLDSSEKSMNLRHDERKQFWMQRGAQPCTSRMYLIKCPLSVKMVFQLRKRMKAFNVLFSRAGAVEDDDLCWKIESPGFFFSEKATALS